MSIVLIFAEHPRVLECGVALQATSLRSPSKLAADNFVVLAKRGCTSLDLLVVMYVRCCYSCVYRLVYLRLEYKFIAKFRLSYKDVV